MAINASQGLLALGLLTVLFGGDILTLFNGAGVSQYKLYNSTPCLLIL